jgi:hypothetical protein
VHGLGGDFYKTWANSDSQKQTLWLSQLLPKELPGARIFSFGYESAPTFSRSVTGFSDAANELLHQLKSIIEQVSEKSQSLSNPYINQALSGLTNRSFSSVTASEES